MVDADLLPQNGRVVLVLQDGRQLEGELQWMSGRLDRWGDVRRLGNRKG
jgi:hypothetical protein